MGLRIWKRINIFPGISINLSKSGCSFSFGGKGARFTVSKKGYRTTYGLPGTGIYYTKYINKKAGLKNASAEEGNNFNAVKESLIKNLEELDTLLYSSNGMNELVSALEEVSRNNIAEAMIILEDASHVPDVSFVLGVLHLYRNDYFNAIYYLENVEKNICEFGGLFKSLKLEKAFFITFPVCDGLTVKLYPDSGSLALCLCNAYRMSGKYYEALQELEKLNRMPMYSQVQKLIFIDIKMFIAADDGNELINIINICSGVMPNSELNSAILLYKAKALKIIGDYEKAEEIIEWILACSSDYQKTFIDALVEEKDNIQRDKSIGSVERSDTQQ